MAPFLKFFSASHECDLKTGRTYFFITFISVSYLLLKCRRLRSRSASFTYLPLNLLFEFTRECFCSRSCSWRRFAACFAAASSSGAYSSNFSKSFTAPSFTVAVFSFRFSSLYKSPLSFARTLFCFSSSLFFILKAIISVSFFLPEKGIFSDFADS